MTGYERPRCETEAPEDVADTTNDSVKAKKPKSANDAAGSSRKPRLPKNLAEEQELNRLDQKEYDEIIERLSYIPGIENHEFLARKEFWEKFYAMTGDTFPENDGEKLNSRARNIVAERRKSRPWYIWGLDGYNREQFPGGWPHLYEDGEEEGASLNSQPSVPCDQAQAKSADPSRTSKIVDKTGSFALPLNELEKVVEVTEKEISDTIRQQNQKKLESRRMRKMAAERKANSVKWNQKAFKFTAESERSTKQALELVDRADKLDAEVAKSDGILNQKQPLLDVQKLVLAARRANDSYGNK
ncbi:hypothetical protein VE00_01970 [Pseudogymnoascus sp. WSF 3629]|nr:hypothetical protein VE00_01970 [Pseudogymnoascus sp. WSF 3629]